MSVVPRPLVWASFVLAVAGLLDSVYLAYEHASGSNSFACPETGHINCAKVTTSTYSELQGIPVAYLGLAWIQGQRREVFLVSGVDRKYTVRINGTDHVLAPRSAKHDPDCRGGRAGRGC